MVTGFSTVWAMVSDKLWLSVNSLVLSGINKGLPGDREYHSFFINGVYRDNLTSGTTETIKAVQQVFADVGLPTWTCDSVDDLLQSLRLVISQVINRLSA